MLPITCYLNYNRYSSEKAYKKMPMGRMRAELREPKWLPPQTYTDI